jgi:hypothetical protein
LVAVGASLTVWGGVAMMHPIPVPVTLAILVAGLFCIAMAVVVWRNLRIIFASLTDYPQDTNALL